MTPDDLANILRFLYGDGAGLGVAQAARDLGTKTERLRELLAGKRDIPTMWADYLLLRLVIRSFLEGWRAPTLAAIAGLSAPPRTRARLFENMLAAYGPA